MNIPFVCGSCHQEGAPAQSQREIHAHNILSNYSISMHGEGLLNKGLIVSATCTSCHTAHHILPHTDVRSSIAKQNIVATCSQCHGMIEQVHRKVIRGELWQKSPKDIPVCIECHQPHKVRKVFYDQGMADRDCLSCHAKEETKRAADGKSLLVSKDHLSGSVHSNTACAQCHTGVTPSKIRSCETVIKKVDCAICHTAQVEQYQTSTHGKLHQQNNPNAPTCEKCHGTHQILGKKLTQSATFPMNVPALCGQCHREGEKAMLRYQGTEHDIQKHYSESIHGKGLLKSGLVVTAMCTSCHTAHGELPANDPASTVHKNNVALTCAQCHRGVYEKHSGSIHSPLVNKTTKELPVCSTCHTAHTIKRTDMGDFKMEIMASCGKCHEAIAKTYFDTYHGKVSKLGYAKTAKCHDCHGSHDVFGVNDIRSHLSHQNIVQTCQQCHPSANRRFAGYLTHSTHHDPDKYPWLFWSFWGMTALLVGTFAGAWLHTLLWIPRALQMRRMYPHHPPKVGEKQFTRFKPLHRALHALMIVSFLTLAITGMTLKFSYTAWAVVLGKFLGGFQTAGYLHRAAAVVMFCIFCVHIWDVIKTKYQTGKSWFALIFGPNSMMFSLRDLREIFTTMKWYLGLGKRPDYGRWTYWEKFDYFAVFWGIAIIGTTGMMLWFPELVTHIVPGWVINVATIIHSDEALLAVGFIFTVHFFNTHFRPDKFPMDIVIFTGRVPLEEFKRDRPDDYAELVANGELDKHLVDPMAPELVRAVRIFGWIALTIGICLIIGIIYAILFAYQ